MTKKKWETEIDNGLSALHYIYVIFKSNVVVTDWHVELCVIRVCCMLHLTNLDFVNLL